MNIGDECRGVKRKEKGSCVNIRHMGTKRGEKDGCVNSGDTVSYTHLTLPTS